MRRMRQLLAFCGVALLAYAGIIVWKGDPLTALYAHHEQQRLLRELTTETAPPPRRNRGVPSRSVREGAPLGLIRIPSIGVHAVVVQGTRADDLAQGPGHYMITALPGSGRVVAIAGHRTTFGAWFRHLDDLARGAKIDLSFRRRRFTYRVTGSRVVLPTDWSILRYPGYEELVLSTCDPVYSASHRLIVFARLATITAA